MTYANQGAIFLQFLRLLSPFLCARHAVNSRGCLLPASRLAARESILRVGEQLVLLVEMEVLRELCYESCYLADGLLGGGAHLAVAQT